jgi:hypothetical protein
VHASGVHRLQYFAPGMSRCALHTWLLSVHASGVLPSVDASTLCAQGSAVRAHHCSTGPSSLQFTVRMVRLALSFFSKTPSAVQA